MLLQIPAAAVPFPKAEEGGGGSELNEGKPRLLLRRHQAGSRSTAGGSQAAQDKLLLGFVRRRGGLGERLEVCRNCTRLHSHRDWRDCEVGVTAGTRVEATERNGRRGARCFGEGNEGVAKGDNTLDRLGLSACAGLSRGDGVRLRGRLRGGEVVGGKDLPIRHLRRRRSDQAGERAVAVIGYGNGESNGIADIQDVSPQFGRAYSEAADSTGEAGQLTFGRERPDVQLDWVRFEQGVLGWTAGDGRGAGDDDRSGEAIARGEALRKHRELACHYRRQGGFVEEGGHADPGGRHHFNALASTSQVHEKALAGQLGLSQY